MNTAYMNTSVHLCLHRFGRTGQMLLQTAGCRHVAGYRYQLSILSRYEKNDIGHAGPRAHDALPEWLSGRQVYVKLCLEAYAARHG